MKDTIMIHVEDGIVRSVVGGPEELLHARILDIDDDGYLLSRQEVGGYDLEGMRSIAMFVTPDEKSDRLEDVIEALERCHDQQVELEEQAEAAQRAKLEASTIRTEDDFAKRIDACVRRLVLGEDRFLEDYTDDTLWFFQKVRDDVNDIISFLEGRGHE